MNEPVTIARDEWDFSAVPEAEIELCFWWEYCRASEGVRAQVEICRAGDGGWVDSVQSSILSVPVVYALRIGGSFPSRPWSLINERSRSWFVGAFQMFGTRPLWTNFGPVVVHPNEIRAESGIPALTLPVLGGTEAAKGPGRQSVLATVNWNFNDEQILESFAAQVLSRRPTELPNKPKRRPLHSPTTVPVPVDRGAALDWLGLHRRHQAGTAWREFEKRYGRAEGEADLAKKAMKARRIIAWLDTGRSVQIDRCRLPEVKPWRESSAARIRKAP